MELRNDIYQIAYSYDMSETVVNDRKTELMLFVIMAMAFFIDGLDGTIVTVALPGIAKAFGMDTADSSWVITVYFVMMAGLILVFGKLSDKGALKKLLVSGFLIFSLSSLVCAYSEPNVGLLLTARAVKGIGAAMLAATGVMIAIKYIRLERRNLALSLTVLGSSLGTTLGPVLGGILTELFSWNFIFLINVPIGIVCALFAMKAVPKSNGFDKSHFDYIGSIMLFIVVITCVYAISTVPSGDFSPLAISSLVIFIVSTAAFIVYESKNSNPVFKVRTFKKLNFSSAVIVFLLMNTAYLGALYLLPFMMEIEMKMDTLTVGLILLVPSIATLILCVPAGRISDKRGTKPLSIASCFLLTCGCVTMAFCNSTTGIAILIVTLILFGCVWGLGGGALGPRVIENAPDEDKAFASSILTFLVYFGSSVGLAAASALFNIGSGAQGQYIETLDPEVFMNGFVFVMIVFAVVSAIITVISYFIKTR